MKERKVTRARRAKKGRVIGKKKRPWRKKEKKSTRGAAWGENVHLCGGDKGWGGMDPFFMGKSLGKEDNGNEGIDGKKK